MIDQQPPAAAFTEEEFCEFDRISHATGSHNNATRVGARIDMRSFIEAHGKAKCDAMWARICASEANLKRARAI